MNRSKCKKLLLLTMACIFVFALSGCSHGVAEAISIVTRSERAKQDIEHMVNGGETKVQSVGTIATPASVVGYINIRDASVSYQEGVFDIEWDTLSDSDKITVHVYAYPDGDKAEGFRLALLSDVNTSGSQKVTFKDEIKPGTYMTFVRVEDSNKNTDSIDLPDTFTIRGGDGALSEVLEDITYTIEGSTIVLRWSDDGSGSYCARILAASTDDIIGETIVMDTRAQLAIPDGITEFRVAVASYRENTMGDYSPIRVELS